jgi:predicted RNA-binding Zn ribbon-like protein
LDLANTVFVSHGKDLDALMGPDELELWTGRVAPQLAVTRSMNWPGSVSADDADVQSFRELRGAIRTIAADLTAGKPPQKDAIDVLNSAATVAPQRSRVAFGDDGALHKEVVADAPVMRTLLSAFAEDAIDLFGGHRRDQLRACQAPNCPLFFLKDHARREWCGPTCGNRVRAARAYRKRVQAAAAAAK